MHPEFLNHPPDCEILSTRVFHHPLGAVVEAWTGRDVLQECGTPGG